MHASSYGDFTQTLTVDTTLDKTPEACFEAMQAVLDEVLKDRQPAGGLRNV